MSTDKTPPRIQRRPARSSDIVRFYGRPSPRTIRATAYERDGEVLGVVGYYLEAGRAVLFSDVAPDVPKFAIWREAKRYMAELKMPAICEGSDRSRAFLERLGWDFVQEIPGGYLYEWGSR